jgi:Lar family restriction alleviation protein
VEENKLKPCPFCGNDKPELVEYCMDDPAYATAYVKCRKCGVCSNRRHATTESAVAWWNGRTSEDRKALEELVFLALDPDDPFISISKGRELLGFEYMDDMRDWLKKYRESAGA